MTELIHWCVKCESVIITTAKTAWCNRNSDCDGVIMQPIGYLDGNTPIYEEIQEPKRVK
jgi:hypothetical protein